MTNVRIMSLTLLTLAARFPTLGQSVVSTHSGVVYFFAGTVFIGDQRLEQKFGRFPDIGEGCELRTEQGRAEVLLTPGVVLRISQNSTIRMLSNKLSDTRVELLAGSTILESNDAGKDTAVTLIFKDWQVRVPREGVYRIDAAPPQLRVYKGEVQVSAQGQKEPVIVKDGETLPLAAVLLTERTTPDEADSFKSWAMNRSQAVAADNATAAQIIDDPDQLDNSGVAIGGFSYFPPTGIPSLGITNPYGVSFWSSYQSMLGSIYFPPYMGYGLGPFRGGWPRAGGWPVGAGFVGGTGWPVGLRNLPRPIYPGSGTVPWRTGVAVHPGGIAPSRAPYPGPMRAAPRVPAPAAGGRAPAHR